MVYESIAQVIRIDKEIHKQKQKDFKNHVRILDDGKNQKIKC